MSSLDRITPQDIERRQRFSSLREGREIALIRFLVEARFVSQMLRDTGAITKSFREAYLREWEHYERAEATLNEYLARGGNG